MLNAVRPRFTEIPNKPHWWGDTLQTPSYEVALDELLAPIPPNAVDHSEDNESTLTTLWPSESGSLNGWRIEDTEIPGR